ncbi:hypothetical protein SIN8267_01539 [Sinobacterium norvegicum]|uniref:Cystatin domain-containing protein n=1 Tax=Sinobacterium norvegicum TaxID=1641715 RepID=A0ABM9AE10_9GAMM|nr:cystatin domain-containing protein [Sinobacterium norvegicum]CAH0991433.1 hypothetical protein SIN8267_01539 [Sinobacterium norvegicum]
MKDYPLKRYAMIMVFSGLLACGDGSNTASQAKNTKQPACGEGIPGGWVNIPVSAEAEAALDSVVKRMNIAAKLDKIVEARSQVVNGVNYAIAFQFDDGSVWHTEVHRSLSNEYTMTKPAAKGGLPPLCPEN